MGVNFEISVALQSIDIPVILSEIPDFEPEKIISIDNWKYENQASLTNAEALNSLPKQGKILQVYAKGLQDGAFFYKDRGIYFCDLFFRSTEPSADSGCVNDRNKNLYRKASEFVIGNFSKFGLLYAAFGCEMLLSEQYDISEKINCSHNVNMWLINKSVSIKLPQKFESTFGDCFTILIKNET